jgi:hypothetical protein
VVDLVNVACEVTALATHVSPSNHLFTGWSLASPATVLKPRPCHTPPALPTHNLHQKTVVCSGHIHAGSRQQTNKQTGCQSLADPHENQGNHAGGTCDQMWQRDVESPRCGCWKVRQPHSQPAPNWSQWCAIVLAAKPQTLIILDNATWAPGSVWHGHVAHALVTCHTKAADNHACRCNKDIRILPLTTPHPPMRPPPPPRVVTTPWTNTNTAGS